MQELGSSLGGGKFANGAITGAYVMLFNEMMHQKKEKAPWDKNGDAKLSKKEADDWWLYGNGEDITVDGNLIDLTGFNEDKASYNAKTKIYCYDTVDAFRDLPWETASTYGGSCFRIVNGTPQMLSQDYHYNMRQNNSVGNVLRNAATASGMPIIPKGVTPRDYRINIQY